MLEDVIFTLDLFCILLLGLVTSHEDIRENKIRNKYIFHALLFAVGFNILLPMLAYGFYFIESAYLKTTLINGALALLVGFLLWHLKIWRAGDGKLFFAYSFLSPIFIYYYGYVQYFPSFTLLINTFIPLFFLLTLNLWTSTSADEKFEILRKIVSPKQLFYTFVSLMSIQWIISIILRYLLPSSDLPTSSFFSILILILFNSLSHDILYSASIPIFVLRIFLDYETMLSYAFITQFLLFFAIFILALNFITSLGSFRFSDRMRITELKAGMCCAEKFVKKGKFYAQSTPDNSKDILDLNYDGLTFQDITRLNTLYEKGKLKSNTVVIKHTLPFAPFLFIGVLLTVLIRGNIIAYLKLMV